MPCAGCGCCPAISAGAIPHLPGPEVACSPRWVAVTLLGVFTPSASLARCAGRHRLVAEPATLTRPPSTTRIARWQPPPRISPCTSPCFSICVCGSRAPAKLLLPETAARRRHMDYGLREAALVWWRKNRPDGHVASTKRQPVAAWSASSPGAGRQGLANAACDGLHIVTMHERKAMMWPSAAMLSWPAGRIGTPSCLKSGHGASWYHDKPTSVCQIMGATTPTCWPSTVESTVHQGFMGLANGPDPQQRRPGRIAAFWSKIGRHSPESQNLREVILTYSGSTIWPGAQKAIFQIAFFMRHRAQFQRCQVSPVRMRTTFPRQWQRSCHRQSLARPGNPPIASAVHLPSPRPLNLHLGQKIRHILTRYGSV